MYALVRLHLYLDKILAIHSVANTETRWFVCVFCCCFFKKKKWVALKIDYCTLPAGTAMKHVFLGRRSKKYMSSNWGVAVGRDFTRNEFQLLCMCKLNIHVQWQCHDAVIAVLGQKNMYTDDPAISAAPVLFLNYTNGSCRAETPPRPLGVRIHGAVYNYMHSSACRLCLRLYTAAALFCICQ